MGKSSNAFFSETTNMIKAKLYMNVLIGPGSHIEYPTGKKNSNFVEDHPRNIPAKFGSNRPSGFGQSLSSP
jgi:hypothetical protein